jgi:hypothetical protein
MSIYIPLWCVFARVHAYTHTHDGISSCKSCVPGKRYQAPTTITCSGSPTYSCVCVCVCVCVSVCVCVFLCIHSHDARSHSTHIWTHQFWRPWRPVFDVTCPLPGIAVVQRSTFLQYARDGSSCVSVTYSYARTCVCNTFRAVPGAASTECVCLRST